MPTRPAPPVSDYRGSSSAPRQDVARSPARSPDRGEVAIRIAVFACSVHASPASRSPRRPSTGQECRGWKRRRTTTGFVLALPATSSDSRTLPGFAASAVKQVGANSKSGAHLIAPINSISRWRSDNALGTASSQRTCVSLVRSSRPFLRTRGGMDALARRTSVAVAASVTRVSI